MIDDILGLTDKINEFKTLRSELQKHNNDWMGLIKAHLTQGKKKNIITLLTSLGEELAVAEENRREFLTKPINIPEGLETNKNLSQAINNLSEGKRAFGLAGFVGKSAEKKILETIQIMGYPPSSSSDWQYIVSYLDLLRRFRELTIRWNALSTEIDLPTVDISANGGLQASDLFALFQKIQHEVTLEKAILTAAKRLFPSWADVGKIIDDPKCFSKLVHALSYHLTKNELEKAWIQKEHFQKILDGRSGPIIDRMREFFHQILGNPAVEDSQIQVQWSELVAELEKVLRLQSKLEVVQRVTDQIAASGAPKYAEKLREPLTSTWDNLLPTNLQKSWRLRRLFTYLNELEEQAGELKAFSKKRHHVEADLSLAYKEVVVKRTWLKLAESASPSIRAALQAYLSAIQKIGKGTGKRAGRYRQDARNAAMKANMLVPCWIMPHYRVSESLPPKIGGFDLVIVDEASQSDLTALPVLLRAQKVLIVGDDKQVSPEGIGLEEEKIQNLMSRFLSKQVEIYRPQMSPERSIYDLCKVVFEKSSVMLKEHFRCVSPIIEYSKREFYNHELRPLRLPKASERLDPPLIDVLLHDGYRDGDTNRAEERFIVEEIKKIVCDDKFINRSIGVVSLLANKQAYLIWETLTKELGPDLLQRHHIACGDARTFQGKERDIMFLSMVVAPNESRIAALSRDSYAQRFNVAASRARDRMYLVRSVSLEHLSDADKLRRSLINHFSSPFAQNEGRVKDLRKLCESPFEQEVYDQLTQRGYLVTPQVRVGQFRIDLVVEGNNDARLAVECDGDTYHGPDKWADDMHRQRILERAGWVFWRCFASNWVRRQEEMIEDLVRTLLENGIEPVGTDCTPRSIYSEQRVLCASDLEIFNLAL